MDKSFLSSAGVSVLTFLLSAVQGIAFARLLGPESRGKLAAVLFIPQLLTLVVAGALQPSFARMTALPQWSRKDITEKLTAATRLSFVAGSLLAPLILVVQWLILPTEKAEVLALSVLYLVIVPFEVVRQGAMGVHHGEGDFFAYNLLRISPSIILAGLVLLVSMFDRSVDVLTALSLQMIALLLPVLCICSRSLKSAGRYKLDKSSLNQVRKLAAGNLASSAVSDFYSKMDQYCIQAIVPFKEQGLYSVGVTLNAGLGIIPNTAALFAFRSNMVADKVQGTGAAIFTQAFLVQLFSAVALFFAVPYLIVGAFGSEYRTGIESARALCCAHFFIGLSSVLEGFLRGGGHNRQIVISKCISAVTFSLILAGSNSVSANTVAQSLIGSAVVNLIIVSGFVARSRERKRVHT